MIVLAGPSGAGQVPPGRAHRPAGAPARRLLQGRRRPHAPADHRGRERRHRRLGRPGLVAARRRDGRASRRCAATAGPRCRSTTSPTNGRNGTHVLELGDHDALRRRGDLRAGGRPAVPRRRPARRGVLRAPAPDGDLLAPADPRPARAPQAAARAGPPRPGADARPAAGGRPRRERGLHAGHRRRGVRRDPRATGEPTGRVSPTAAPAGRRCWSWPENLSGPVARLRRTQVLAMHRGRVETGCRGRGRSAPPPWAVARELGRRGCAASAGDEVVAALADGTGAGLPRHPVAAPPRRPRPGRAGRRPPRLRPSPRAPSFAIDDRRGGGVPWWAVLPLSA